MKVSNKTLVIVLFAVFVGCLTLACLRWHIRVHDPANYFFKVDLKVPGQTSVLHMNMPVHYFFDFDLRYNEICCSHTGVNPFDVWAQKVEVDDYRGHCRPDRPGLKVTDMEKKMVHAYPPWHTTFFWFYGWLSPLVAKLFFVCLNLVVVIGGSIFVWRQLPRQEALFVLAFAAVCVANSFADGILVGNYGVAVTGAILLLVWSLRKNLDVMSGLCWAFIMIKPHIGVLFFWPLLFQKRYSVIGIAILTCVLATLLPSAVYGESPVNLILQIPEIGRPYIDVSWSSTFGLLVRWFGDVVFFIVPLFFFILCGIWSFLVRRSESWIIRFSPALLLFPHWTYSQRHDWVIQVILYAFIAFAYIQAKNITFKCVLRVYLVLAVAWVVFLSVWATLVTCVNFKTGVMLAYFHIGASILMSWAPTAIILYITWCRRRDSNPHEHLLLRGF